MHSPDDGGGGKRACVNKGYVAWKDNPKIYGTALDFDNNVRMYPQPLTSCSSSHSGIKNEGVEDGDHCYEGIL